MSMRQVGRMSLKSFQVSPLYQGRSCSSRLAAASEAERERPETPERTETRSSEGRRRPRGN